MKKIDYSSITLGETLNIEIVKLSDLRCILKVGTKKGSAFIFCGPGDELWRSIDALDALYAKQGEEDIKKAYEKRDDLFASFPTLEMYSRKECVNSKNTYFGSFEEYQRQVEKHFHKLASYQKHLEKLEHRIRTRGSFRSRKIVNIYQSIAEENTIIVILEGYENGVAWTYDEYVNGIPAEEDEE